MKQIIGVIFILLTLSSCAPRDMFPGKITTVKTSKSVRIKGTRVFIQPKEGFQYIPQLSKYKKVGKAELRVTEANTYGFFRMQQKLTRQALEANGVKVDVIENIKFNQFDAVYTESPSGSSFPNQSTLGLFFGDDNFAVIIQGDYTTGDMEEKIELQEMMKSIYYDDKLQIDPFELADFDFDHSITNMKYAMTASNFYRYAENGKKDAEDETANAFEIGSFGKMTDEKAYNGIYNMISAYASKIEFDNKTITKTKINGFNAYVLESKITFQFKEGVMYIVYVEMDKSTIAFMGNAYTNTDSYLDKFKRTVLTIKEK